jgi:hypothetical protein
MLNVVEQKDKKLINNTLLILIVLCRVETNIVEIMLLGVPNT